MLTIRTNFFYQIKVIAMMKNYEELVEINHNLNWPDIPDHPYRINLNYWGFRVRQN